VTVSPTGDRSYVLYYRVAGRQRWLTIGRHGSPWTPDMARKEAMRLRVEVARGVDPAAKRETERRAVSFGELCDLYLNEGVAHKKASTIRSDKGRIEHHLKPLLGRLRADAIRRGDIERLLNEVRNGRTAESVPTKRRPGSLAHGGSGAGAQCVMLASAILQFGVDRGIRPDNPARVPILGALLGHREAQTTLRYSHLSADPLRHAADTIAATIEAAMNGKVGVPATVKETGN
jgi:hypothetical protein